MPLNPRDVFNITKSTKMINIIPNTYGMMLNSGIYNERGSVSTVVEVMRVNHSLKLLDYKPRGSEPQPNQKPSRNKVYLDSLHIPVVGNIHGKDIQDVVDFMTGVTATNLSELRAMEYASLVERMNITKELMLVEAFLKGKVVDRSGDIVLDLFDKFGYTKKVINFELTTSTTNVLNKCRELRRYMRDNLKGEVMNGVKAVVSESFYDLLINHENVEKYYLQWSGAQALANNDGSQPFKLAGVEFVPYDGAASDIEDVTIEFIADGFGHAIPMGTRNVFELINTPSEIGSLFRANTVGIPFYSMETTNKLLTEITINAESDPLPLTKRPDLLVEITAS